MALYYVTTDGFQVRKLIDGSLNSPDATESGADSTGGTSSSKEYVLGPTMYFDISPDGARIAYSTCKEYGTPKDSRYRSVHQYDISIVNIDGTDSMSVTQGESIDIFPAWSPDGSQIAFVSERHRGTSLIAGQLVIYTIATGESRDVPLTIGDRVAPYAPAWSPDGRTIAFVAYDGDINNYHYRSTTPAVYTVGIDGSGLTRISTTSTGPSWSPDGRRIVLFAPYGDEAAFYSFAADGSEAVRIASLPADFTYTIGDPARDLPLTGVEISWAPDGSEILFDSLAQRVLPDGSGVLESLPVSFNAASTGQAQNGSSGPKPAYPRIAAWSPDGSRIAVGATTSIYEGVNVVLHTISRDGTDPQALVKNGVTLVAVPARQDSNAGMNSCSAGYVVSEPENNPGLVEDCKTLIRAKDELRGGVDLNWGPGVPIEEWTGITLEPAEGPPQSPARRVTKLVIRWPQLPLDDFRKLRGSMPGELSGLDELRILDLRHNRLRGEIPAALASLENLLSLRLEGNSLIGCIPAELEKTFGSTLSNGVGLPYCE